jgi:hypothetical protein
VYGEVNGEAYAEAARGAARGAVIVDAYAERGAGGKIDVYDSRGGIHDLYDDAKDAVCLGACWVCP